MKDKERVERKDFLKQREDERKMEKTKLQKVKGEDKEVKGFLGMAEEYLKGEIKGKSRRRRIIDYGKEKRFGTR